MEKSKVSDQNGGLTPAQILGLALAKNEQLAADEIVPISDRPLRSNSYLTAVTIIADDKLGVVGGKLERNGMTGRPELNRRPIEDHHVHRIRAEIERCFKGGVDRDGRDIGMKLSASDIFAAVDQVCAERTYHPVREYLSRLKWDGVERLSCVPDELLGAERSTINMAIVRRFFVSAVARAMEPGCKVDTVPILVGKQGAKKSSFFRVLAGEWFCDTGVDIYNKDSLQVLRRAWLYEWAELDVLRRARDVAAAKAFLASQVDTYRPSYGRLVVDVPRGCVIVGTSNPEEFLTDDTGNRRFWPLRTGDVDLKRVEEQRDQLWAEARVLYEMGEQWWLTDDEETAVALIHEQHMVSDSWDGAICDWAAARLIDFSTAEVLEGALDKPRGMWTRADEMRVASTLRRGGWKQSPNKAHGAPRKWLAIRREV